MFKGSSSNFLELRASALVVTRIRASFANAKLNNYYIDFSRYMRSWYSRCTLNENGNFNKQEKIVIIKRLYYRTKTCVKLSFYIEKSYIFNFYTHLIKFTSLFFIIFMFLPFFNNSQISPL